ncbi:unnamed protein product [Brassica napus]|uniref:(rape) hypothetical protein n=1 Tax=Brassica napus TaxID=3708 RepID=A0A816XBP6_BRANA|nr:unnamed protein product [Brassica napus]
MDVRGGCCIARYGGYGGHYSLSKAERIMLRFRPIAPKPSNDGGGGSPGAGKYCSSTTSGGSSDVSSNTKRGKRKYHKESSGVNSRRCNKRKRPNTRTAVTLSLLPDLNVSPVEKQRQNGPLWLSFSGGDHEMLTPYKTAEISQRTVVVSSCVTVERVTDAWTNGYGLGKTDDEKKLNLAREACPGFISDGVGRVTWTNKAYRKMAKEDINIPVEDGAPGMSYDNFHVIVRLVMKERPMLTYPAFTCSVRLQYTCQDRERGSVTVPCDVWRMDDGGFAWKLDVKTAFSFFGLTLPLLLGALEEPPPPRLLQHARSEHRSLEIVHQLLLRLAVFRHHLHVVVPRLEEDEVRVRQRRVRHAVGDVTVIGLEGELGRWSSESRFQTRWGRRERRREETRKDIGEGSHRFLSAKRRRSDGKYFVSDLNEVVLVSKYLFICRTTPF